MGTRDPVTPISNATAEWYAWGNGCDGWHLLRSSSLSVIAERMPPGSAETPHRHAKAQQFFFVLTGELVMEANGARHQLRAREGIHIAAGVAHTARNDSEQPVEFLVISEPPSHGDRQLAE